MVQSIYERLSEERKAMQLSGDLPEWYTTAGYQLFKDKYLYDTDTVKKQFKRIAKTAASHLAHIGLEKKAQNKFFELLWKGWLSPSTPVLANMGTNRGLTVSCSGNVTGDSIEGFYKARLETALLTKYGFGTSGYLGDIRPRGTPISVGGKASGVLPVFKGYIQDMRDVAQGTTRRGSFAAYLPIEHGDFDEVCDYVFGAPDDANIGWIISDEFIQKLEAGDKEAVRRYQKTLKLKMVLGKGYYSFVDKINANRPQMYKDLDLKVKASNLCFTGDTLVATADGRNAVAISDLATESNGKIKFPVYSSRWSHTKQRWINEVKNAVAFLTSDSAKVLTITLSDGSQFRCTEDHRLALSNGDYVTAKDAIGATLQPFYTSLGSTGQNNIESIHVLSIESNGYEAVYDLTVEDNNNFNIITKTEDENYLQCSGLLVHNCDEITLFADEDHTFTCVISSMNVSKWHEWKGTDAVYWSTIFLDCVAEDFIQNAKKISGLEKAVRFTEKGRALGLGQCGFHTLLQQDKLPFEEMGAFLLNIEISKHIQEEALRASKWMAEALGEPEWCKGYGVRNTHRTSIPPTKSSAILIGGISEGINPDPAMTYTQTSAGGEMDRMNPVLLQLMKDKGIYTKKNVKSISEKQGSVQHVTWLTDEEKKVFKTAFEINQEVVLRLASARAEYVDQWQSLNLFFSAEEDPAWISHIHRLAFLDPKMLGLYYITTNSGVSGSKECEACQ